MKPFTALAFRRTTVALAIGAAVLAAVVTSAYVSENLNARGLGTSFGAILFVELVQWLLWAAAVLLIPQVEGRWGIGARGWVMGVAAHLAAALALFLVINAILVPLIAAFHLGYGPGPLGQIFLVRARSKLLDGLGLYALIAGVLALVALATDRYKREAYSARLEAELADARVRVLQSHFQPHFLFNTLNMLAGLVRAGRHEDAVEAIAELADLLRDSIRYSEQSSIRLDEELTWLSRYFALQRLRFGPLLVVQEDIAVEARSARLPPLLLQPIVENAVKHGLRNREGGTVGLRARREAGRLVLEVSDDGAGPVQPDPNGTGLRTTRERLTLRYGASAGVELQANTVGGTVVRITLPYEDGTAE